MNELLKQLIDFYEPTETKESCFGYFKITEDSFNDTGSLFDATIDFNLPTGEYYCAFSEALISSILPNFILPVQNDYFDSKIVLVWKLDEVPPVDDPYGLLKANN